MEQLIAFCRPGFEVDAGRELTEAAASAGIFGYFEPGAEPGYLAFNLPGPASAANLLSTLSLDQLVFVRDWFIVLADIALPESDRVGAVIESLRISDSALPDCSRVEIRLTETNEDHDLGKFARKWVSPLSKGLRGAGFLSGGPNSETEVRMEVLLLSFERAVLGISFASNRARFPSGILRLKASPKAPSRSALKLEEAWKVFLPTERALDYLGGGKSAVDLGAAPGGWTWQLVEQGMNVTAVDNGPMNQELMATGQVTHVRADGYQWEPKRGVDWMVCDIVDHPRRTAQRMVEWLTGKLCRYSVFNLKLPMKKRYDEWTICRDILEKGLAASEMNFRLKARHLYHDREEITCFVERLD